MKGLLIVSFCFKRWSLLVSFRRLFKVSLMSGNAVSAQWGQFIFNVKNNHPWDHITYNVHPKHNIPIFLMLVTANHLDQEINFSNVLIHIKRSFLLICLDLHQKILYLRQGWIYCVYVRRFKSQVWDFVKKY